MSELHSTGAEWPPMNPTLPDESLVPSMQVMTVKPRAVDYAHLAGKYVRMERVPLEGEVVAHDGTIGMECTVAEVSDVHDGVLICSDYGYAFKVTADDAHLWRWHIWSDERTRNIFAANPRPSGQVPTARARYEQVAQRAETLDGVLRQVDDVVVELELERELGIDGKEHDLPDRIREIAQEMRAAGEAM